MKTNYPNITDASVTAFGLAELIKRKFKTTQFRWNLIYMFVQMALHYPDTPNWYRDHLKTIRLLLICKIVFSPAAFM